MPTPLRFHLDEHVSPAVAEGLRRRGIDVTTTLDAGFPLIPTIWRSLDENGVCSSRMIETFRVGMPRAFAIQVLLTATSRNTRLANWSAYCFSCETA
jgi:hypothetical protein